MANLVQVCGLIFCCVTPFDTHPPQLVRHNQNLKKLGLAYNSIGRQGCQALTQAIKANKSLQQLQLLPGEKQEMVQNATGSSF
jgi:hypothetical protein